MFRRVALAPISVVVIAVGIGCGYEMPKNETVVRIDGLPENAVKLSQANYFINPNDKSGETTLRVERGQILEMTCRGMIDMDPRGRAKGWMTNLTRRQRLYLMKFWPDSAGAGLMPKKREGFPDESVHVGCPLVQVGRGDPVAIKSYGVFRVLRGGDLKLFPNFPRGLGSGNWYGNHKGGYGVELAVYEEPSSGSD